MKSLLITLVFLYIPFSGWSYNYSDTTKSGSSVKMIKKAGAGIFITAADFAEGKKVCVDSNSGEKQKIKKHYIFNTDYIDVVQGNAKMRFNKDSIYGYEDNDSIAYRFYGKNRDEYRILEVGAIVLYMTEERDFASKHYKPVVTYFFSTGYNTPIQLLTLKNIKHAFPDEFVLHHYLDMEFAEKEIHSYNEAKKMHLINYMINKYKQN